MNSVSKFLGAASVAALALFVAPAAMAQGVPVIDSAVLSQATLINGNTSQIMNSNQQILTTVNQTLQALTGNRQTTNLAQTALGTGFNMGGAPNFSSLLGGGEMQWGNLGSFGNTASTIINGLKLVKSLASDGSSGYQSGPNTAYLGSVNTASAVLGMVSGAQTSSQNRVQALQSASQQIGTAADVKGSIDQNSQLQVQTGLTINELIGTINANNATLNAEQQQMLAVQAYQAQVLTFQPTKTKAASQDDTTNGQD